MEIDLPIDLLKTFSAVAETGSFTRAGEVRHITQSAVSMQMKRLEGNLGSPLFHKQGRRVDLTPAGETLLRHAARILNAHRDAVAAFSHPELMGNISFGCAEDYTHKFLSAVLAGFRKAFPCIRVDIHSGPGVELYRMLQKDDLDLCLLESIPREMVGLPRAAEGRDEILSCSHAFGENGLVVYREPLVWAAARSGTAWMETPLPLALYHEGCSYRAMALDALRRADIESWISVVSPSISSILAAVRAGLAVAPIGASLLDDTLRSLGPEQGFPLLPVSEVSLHRAPSANNRLVDCFTDYVVDAFRQIAARSPVTEAPTGTVN